MRMSCMSAISTGTAYFGSKRSAMYALMTSSDERIAMIADFATVWPNVGPIVLESDVWAKPNFAFSAFVIRSCWAGFSDAVEIWNALAPWFLAFLLLLLTR